jgi:hypothetical protein
VHPLDGRGVVGRTEESTPELDGLGLDPPDLGEPDGMDLRRGAIQRRVGPDQQAIGLLAARQVLDARLVVRPRGGQDDLGEQVR